MKENRQQLDYVRVMDDITIIRLSDTKEVKTFSGDPSTIDLSGYKVSKSNVYLN